MIPILCAVIAALSAIAVAFITASQNKKISETHHQITQNGGMNNPPTVPDKLAGILQTVDRIDKKLDDHIEWHLHKKD